MPWVEREEYFRTRIPPPSLEVIFAGCVVVQPDYGVIRREPCHAVGRGEDGPPVSMQNIQCGSEGALHGEKPQPAPNQGLDLKSPKLLARFCFSCDAQWYVVGVRSLCSADRFSGVFGGLKLLQRFLKSMVEHLLEIFVPEL
jgi:hypothetical protein